MNVQSILILSITRLRLTLTCLAPLSLVFITLLFNTAHVQASPDIAILFQRGHVQPPAKALIDHRTEASFLYTADRHETSEGIDLRLWRWRDPADGWQIYRHWPNVTNWQSIYKDKDLPHERIRYHLHQMGNTIELLDAATGQLLQRMATSGRLISSYFYFVDESNSYLVLKLEIEEAGRRQLTLHFSPDGQHWRPWTLPGLATPTELVTLYIGDQHSDFVARENNGPWYFFRTDAHGQIEPIDIQGLGFSTERILWLDSNRFAAAQQDSALKKTDDEGWTWRLFQRRGDAEWVALHDVLNLAPEQIHSIGYIAAGFFKVVLRDANEPDVARRTHFYATDAQGQPQPLHQVIADLPERARYLRVLAKGALVGAAELDDLNGNGIPGEWTWRLRDPAGVWRAPHELLRDAPDKNRYGYGSGADWAWGDGILWVGRAYLRDGAGRWQLAADRLPGVSGSLKDYRNGLVGNGKEYWLRQPEGDWLSVNALVAQHRPGATITQIDSRNLTLLIDVQPDQASPSERLVLIRDRQGQWVELGQPFYDPAAHPVTTASHAPFLRIEASQTHDAGRLQLLREAGDANRNGQYQETRLLVRRAGQWALDPAAVGAHQHRYQPERGVRVETDPANPHASRFSFLDAEGQWRSIQGTVPGAPAIVHDAYVFADGAGQALLGQTEAGGREWSFYLQTGADWQPLAQVAPNPFPRIGAVYGIGGRAGFAAQELGDADGNGVPHEWRYYVRAGKKWVDVRTWLPELPNHLQSLRISADGRLLIARAEPDADSDRDQPLQPFLALWNDEAGRFIDLREVLSLSEDGIGDARSLWHGAGLALYVVESAASRGISTRLTSGHWRLYELAADNHWRPIREDSDIVEVRGDAQGYLLAMRRADNPHWELWGRTRLGEQFDRWSGGSVVQHPIIDVRFFADGRVALQESDVNWTERGRWSWWARREAGLVALGHAADSEAWLGFDYEVLSGEQLRFADARHYMDGQSATTVPAPLLWLHRNATLGDSERALYAPELLNQWLAAPRESAAETALAIDALGLGPRGMVVLYQREGQRFAVAFSEGQLWLERHPLAGGAGEASDVMFLVNALPGGDERLLRLDDPARWVWAQRLQDARVYYDERGYFYSETEAVSELASFRVNTEIYSFSQLGSYLFRPDRLEQRLGVPEGRLFSLTARDRERLDQARKLAPGDVDLTTLHPPRLTVPHPPPEKVDQGTVDLDLHIQGRGISAESIVVRVLGAGVAKTAPPSLTDATIRDLRIRKSVPLLPGKNMLEIAVYDRDGLFHARRVPVEYAPPDADLPRLWLAIVASSEYDSRLLNKLPLTRNDARRIAEIFQKQQGERFSDVQIAMWCQQLSECQGPPLRRIFDRELPEFFSRGRAGDFFALYISGHGLRHEGEYFVVPQDGQPGRPDTLVSWSKLRALLAQLPLGRKLVLLDTCHAGAALHDERDRNRLVQQAAEYDGLYVVAATAADASAYELSDLSNGLFTYVVAQGLEGEAVNADDQGVYFEGLTLYIAQQVRRLSSAKRLRMEPYVPILRQDMDFLVARMSASIPIDLRLMDFSADQATQRERETWWRQELTTRLPKVRFLNRDSAQFGLDVIEEEREPRQIKLVRIDGSRELGRWQIKPDEEIGAVLDSLTQRLSHEAKKLQPCQQARGLIINTGTCNER